MALLVRAAVLTNYFEVARHLGLNPQPLLREAGLGSRMLADAEQRVPLTAVTTLLEASARETGCETFGLRMAESRQLADFGAISLLLTHQPTLRAVLEVIIQYQQLLNESLAVHVEDAGRNVILREELVGEGEVVSRQATELAIGVLFRLCAALLGKHWPPQSVNFTHAAPADLAVHRRVFRCRVNFGAEFNGIVCPAAALDYPNPAADPAMTRYAARFVESMARGGEPSIRLEVRKAIYLGLPMGRASIEQVAQALGMNVRTLQRRLDEEGVTFSELLNEVRRELVQRYLDNPRHSLARIGELLGYTMPSSFTRWFSVQLGTAPANWRVARVRDGGGGRPRAVHRQPGARRRSSV